MKQIIIVKPNTVSAEDRQRLQQDDFVVLEHPDPSEVRVINMLDGFKGDELIDCLVKAAGLFPQSQAKFATELFEKLKKR